MDSLRWITGALRTTVADLRCRYRRDGLWLLLSKVLRRAGSAVYSREEIVVLVKDLEQIIEMAFPETLRVEAIEARHLDALHEFNRSRCNSKADARAAAALARGYRGYVGYRDGEVVGYYWWVDREIEPHHSDIAHYGLEIDLEPGEVYGYDFFLLEGHRGEGNSMEFLYKVETALRELGYRTLWGYVVAGNKPARWLYSLRGYRSVRKIALRRVLGRQVAA